MRNTLLSVLTEAPLYEGRKEEYTVVFAPLFKIANEQSDKDVRDTLNQFFSEHLDFAKKTLKRHDRIIWYLRLARIAFCEEERGYFGSSKGEFEDILSSYAHEYTQRTEESPPVRWSTAFLSVKRDLEHYLSLPIEGIQRVVFGNQGISALIEELNQLEDAWKKSRKHTVVPREEDKIVVDCGEGWAWFLLPRAACSDEGSAMGHCGNEPREGTNDQILSLRQKKGNGLWKPHATFIREANGGLSEMKGRFNKKPGEADDANLDKIHDCITKLLLRKDLVSGLKGGGYQPENNFSLSDLEYETRTEILDQRPELARAAEYAELKGRDEIFVEKLEQEYDNASIGRRYPLKDAGPEKCTVADFADAVNLLNDILYIAKSADLVTLISIAKGEYPEWLSDGETFLDFLKGQNAVEEMILRVFPSVEEFIERNNHRLKSALKQCETKIIQSANKYILDRVRELSFEAPIEFEQLEGGEIIVTIDSLHLADALAEDGHNEFSPFSIDTIYEYGWLYVSESMGAWQKEMSAMAKDVNNSAEKALEKILTKVVFKLCRDNKTGDLFPETLKKT